MSNAAMMMGPLVMATAKFSLATEVARRTGGSFVHSMDAVMKCWPSSADSLPNTDTEALAIFRDVADRAALVMCQ